jgi:hypothetical protein
MMSKIEIPEHQQKIMDEKRADFEQANSVDKD